MFPSSRKALWAHSAAGAPVDLQFPKVCISVSEQVLFLAYGQSRSGKIEKCYLVGDVSVEADCSEVVILLNSLSSAEANSMDFPGTVNVPTKLKRNSRHEVSYMLDKGYLISTLTNLSDRVTSESKVHVSEFISATAECTLFAGSNQIHCDIDVDVIIPNSEFTITPIQPVTFAKTALSKSVLGNEKHGVISSQQKSGYLTMDQYRKVVLLLESDPKVLTVPIIGIWVSGVDLVTDPFVWSSCVRYMHTSQVRDRVPKPTDPFLLIHKSPLMSSVQFFDCVPMSTALTYALFSGTQGFSMAKEVTEKRKGKLFCKLDPQPVSTVKGQQLAEHLEYIATSREKENRIPATHSCSKQKRTENDDDSLPWSSPFPYKPKGSIATPSVPEISLLDESNPIAAPRPTRLALHDVYDQRLNRSPTSKHGTLLIPTQPVHRQETASRKIEFHGKSPQEAGNATYNVKASPSLVPLSPSLRSSHPMNYLPDRWLQTPPPTSVQSQVSNFTHSVSCKRDLSFEKPMVLDDMPAKCNLQFYEEAPKFDMTEKRVPNMSTPDNHCQPKMYRQPFAAVTPMQQAACSNCNLCQCRVNRGVVSHAPVSSLKPTHPLSIITDNVQRLLLSPQVPASTSNDLCQPPNVDPPPMVAVTNTPSNSFPANSRSLPVSPEVQEILRQQENQLNTLQLQIQKLLQAQSSQNVRLPQSSETQTVHTKCATVNTGISLLEGNSFHNEETHSQSAPSTHDSTNESSRSHSLTQHDLTTLDLPTQATSRSFTSDINVDYESYDGSPTGSPQRAGESDSHSDESWQSPVLGESVSMIAEAESVGQESTRHQLDIIIKNVQDLLAKHSPTKAQCENKEKAYSGNESDLLATVGTSGSIQTTSPPECENAPGDIGAVTRAQLRKMGIEIEVSSPPAVSEPVIPTPRVQYISMMMTDSMVSDSNRSMELNALALKYLQDDQLTELAQLTIHRRTKRNETDLLRQVLTQTPHSSTKFESMLGTNNLSLASQQYLKRYALTDNKKSTMDMDSCNSIPPQDILDAASATPKSTTPQDVFKPVQAKPLDTSSTTDASSIQVLDIARLKELPKFL